MIALEHALGDIEVEFVFAVDIPREFEQEVEVVELNGVFGALRIHALEFFEFFAEKFGDACIPFFALGSFFELAGVLDLWVVAELVLDGAHLLVQKVLALLFVEVFAHFVLDLVAHLEHLNFCGEVLKYHHDALFDVHFFEHGLLFGDIGVHIRRDEIDQKARAVYIADGKLRFGRNIGAFANDLKGEVFDGVEHHLELFVGAVDGLFGQDPNFSLHVRFCLGGLQHFKAALALNDHR